ncbi:MAG: matrixin family metalloprotease [Oligoflexia bacterium]|nr:matrixin family metalloprotease [Oligoflexia bacterium]
MKKLSNVFVFILTFIYSYGCGQNFENNPIAKLLLSNGKDQTPPPAISRINTSQQNSNDEIKNDSNNGNNNDDEKLDKNLDGNTNSKNDINNNNKIPLKWNQSNFPLQLQISSHFNDSEITTISDATNLWSSNLEIDVPLFNIQVGISNNSEGYRALNLFNDNILGIYKSSDWFPTEYSKALAITQFFGKRVNSGTKDEYIELKHADILINYQSYFFSNLIDGNTDESGTSEAIFNYDLMSVVLHELGHLVGLNHNSSNDERSVMNPTITLKTKYRSLTAIDIENLQKNHIISNLNIKDLDDREEGKEEFVTGVIEIYRGK